MESTYPGSGDRGPLAVPALYPGADGGTDGASFSPEVDGELRMSRAVDQTIWQIGGDAEVAWIAAQTRAGRTIDAAIPPIFGAYATVVVPENDEDKVASDDALLTLVCAQPPQQPWWLGYLETGVADLVFPDAPRAQLYSGWSYVLAKAGPDQAATWRTNDDATPWHSALPELMFPLDQSWLVSTLWDDDWRCVGGPANLVESILRHPRLDAHPVAPDGDAIPPGHQDG